MKTKTLLMVAFGFLSASAAHAAGFRCEASCVVVGRGARVMVLDGQLSVEADASRAEVYRELSRACDNMARYFVGRPMLANEIEIVEQGEREVVSYGYFHWLTRDYWYSYSRIVPARERLNCHADSSIPEGRTPPYTGSEPVMD